MNNGDEEKISTPTLIPTTTASLTFTSPGNLSQISQKPNLPSVKANENITDSNNSGLVMRFYNVSFYHRN